MSLQNVILIFIAVLAIFLAMDSVYTVHETERAILLRFGAVVEADVEPGLHFKLPIAEDVKKADGRVLTLDSSPETYFTLEKKPLIVDSFAKWRISNVESFYTATSFDERRGERILQERVNEGLRNQISRRDMHEVVSGERDKLMFELKSDLNQVMNEAAGIVTDRSSPNETVTSSAAAGTVPSVARPSWSESLSFPPPRLSLSWLVTWTSSASKPA